MESAIPKVIHYCWFGKGNKPVLVKKCIKSWEKYLPDYQIIEWNEDNFDINCNLFVKQAYLSKKFAFVSDYVRLFALYNFGGIYMDTDVEVIKKIDPLLNQLSFTGFETNEFLTTALMGAVKNHPWFYTLLDYYTDRTFFRKDGSMDLKTNVKIITEITKENYQIQLDNTLQLLKDGLKIYPREYFNPKDYNTGEIHLTKNTYIIHHFSGSWLPNKERYRLKITWVLLNLLKSLFGHKNYKAISRFFKKYIFTKYA